MRQVTIGRLWDYPCMHSFIKLTGFVSSDLENKIHTFFVGSCPVSVVFSSRTIHTERTHSHPQSGSGAFGY